jgi:hypothetical protein
MIDNSYNKGQNQGPAQHANQPICSQRLIEFSANNTVLNLQIAVGKFTNPKPVPKHFFDHNGKNALTR